MSIMAYVKAETEKGPVDDGKKKDDKLALNSLR